MTDVVTTRNDDDLQRSRLTVFFRLLLALPHLFWYATWGSGMFLLAPVLWIATLVKGRPPEGLRDLYADWIRYGVDVYAYVALLANPFPGFLGKRGTYPVEVGFAPPPDRQRRRSVLLRFFLALPPLLLAGALTGGGGSSYGSGLIAVVALFGWFACLARGRMPEGMQRAGVYAVEYLAQAYAYLFLLTDRYPDSHPATAAPPVLPEHPVALTIARDEPRRSRVLVFFRLLLAVPHFVWATLWGVVALLVGLANWLFALVAGRPAAPLHRFLTRYVRYLTHLNAFVLLVGGLFPGFAGAPGSYPVDVELPGVERQSRWKTLFRLFLALPALFLGGALSVGALVAAVGAWFFALITGRVPLGVRALGAWSLRYSAQTYAYLYLLTGRYPYSGPGACDRA